MSKSFLVITGMVIRTTSPIKDNAQTLSLLNKTGEDIHVRLRYENLKTPVSALLTKILLRHPANNEILIFPQ